MINVSVLYIDRWFNVMRSNELYCESRNMRTGDVCWRPLKFPMLCMPTFAWSERFVSAVNRSLICIWSNKSLQEVELKDCH